MYLFYMQSQSVEPTEKQANRRLFRGRLLILAALPAAMIQGLTYRQQLGGRWRLITFALVMAAFYCSATYARHLDVMTQPFYVEVNVDATGHVTAAQPMVKLPDNIDQIVTHTVFAWQFQPFQKDGHPVAVTTWLITRLHYFRSPGESRVRKEVLYVGNGPYIESAPMRYPHNYASRGIEAIFVMQATVEPDGSIDQISALRTITSLGKPAKEQAKEAVEEIAKWKAHPVMADGKPVATRITISRTFALDDVSLSGFPISFWDQEPFKPSSDSPDQSAAPVQLPGTELAMPGDALIVENAPQVPAQ